MVANKARQHGVNIDALQWVDGCRVGTYYTEFGASPRPSRVIYDRAGSAMACIEAGQIPWDEVVASTRATFAVLRSMESGAVVRV